MKVGSGLVDLLPNKIREKHKPGAGHYNLKYSNEFSFPAFGYNYY